MKKNQIDFVTMGCSKNLVDTEKLMKQFEANGYTCVHDSDRPQGEIAVISTCGFIDSAKEESINTILSFVEAKKQGLVKKVFVMGCLSQRYQKELEESIPEVDKYYGKFNYRQLLTDLGKAVVPRLGEQRLLTTPSHYAYLKIAEGCNRYCAFCAIPLMTGNYKSRSEEDVINEVKDLVRQGVKEFQVIAQELTYYGVDIDGKQHIAQLIDRISDIEGVEWIRLHYAYPFDFPMDLLDVIREKDNVCKYLDIALQHVSDHVLQRMHRHVTKKETIGLLDAIRKGVPGIAIRTTLMVGFPGETEKDFQELLEFVRQERFERMGAFMYSREEGTYSASHYKDNVPQKVKQRRLDELMEVQRMISSEIEGSCVGTTMKVIIDRKENGYFIGRSEFSSPEIDPEVYIPAENNQLKTGEFYTVSITDSTDYELFAMIKD